MGCPSARVEELAAWPADSKLPVGEDWISPVTPVSPKPSTGPGAQQAPSTYVLARQTTPTLWLGAAPGLALPALCSFYKPKPARRQRESCCSARECGKATTRPLSCPSGSIQGLAPALHPQHLSFLNEDAHSLQAQQLAAPGLAFSSLCW